MRTALCLSCAVVGLFPPALAAQQKGPRDAVVIFKDGFYVKGKAVQKKDFITDPYSGATIVIPAGGEYLYVDDEVRRINFSMAQVQDVFDIEPEILKNVLRFKWRDPPRVAAKPVPPGWYFETVDPWNNRAERSIRVRTAKGKIDLVQRICYMTPSAIFGYSSGYDWGFAYQTREFPLEDLRRLVLDCLTEKTKLKDIERRVLLARFLAQAGLYEPALKELKEVEERYPEQKAALKELATQVQQQLLEWWSDNVAKLQKAGQHENVQAELTGLDKSPDMAKLLSDKHRLMVQDLKSKYETWNTELRQARELIAELPKYSADRTAFGAAAKAIDSELSIDTIGRLKTFLDVAPQHTKQLKDGQTPTQKTDEVLALAVSGWLQGDNAASTDAKSAMQLWRTRKFLQEYLRTDDVPARKQLVTSFTRDNDIPIDVVIRIIRLLPPTSPNTDKLDSVGPTKLATDEGEYYLQLPPEYNPNRPYPVLLLLQSHREGAEVLIKRWQFEAARHGFILAAPLWGGKSVQPKYEYTTAEHAVVLDTLRDLRRRFNVDSDRVFLFGWEQGATAAWDIGLAHPDQFAGVLPMNGDVTGFPQKYATNAQYLPFYIVEGDRNGIFPRSTRIVFKEWIRSHYPSLYIEYKGRSSEWYSSEMPTMMDWMSRKRRFLPLKEMGRYHTGGVPGKGEEFKSMRAGDNRFYWLSSDEILDSHINSYQNWSLTTKPATLQASCAVANEQTKAGARIWTQFNIRTSGVRQVTLWIAPNQVDFSQPVRVRCNNTQIGGDRHIQPSLATMLEQLYASGDRQRLFVAKIDLRL
jgi:pimeloyl-ACP methyl ester carboxylesterase